MAVALLDVTDAAGADPDADVKPKALVPRIELDFKTAHHNETFISMVGILSAWNFMLLSQC